MAAYWPNTGTRGSETGGYRVIYTTIPTTATTTATSCTVTISYGRNFANANWVSVADPLPKAEHDSLIALHRMFLLGIDPLRTAPVLKPACVGRARTFRHLPRGKLDRWPSLKEKRIAWGDFS